MKYLKVVGSAFLIGLTGALMPGPMLIAVLFLAPRGMGNVGLVVAGHAAVEMTIVIAFWLGLARLIRRGGGRVFLVMKIVGGLALIALGAIMLRDAGRVSLTPDAPPMHPFLIGVVVSVSNPYFLFWWATVGLGLASQAMRVGRAGPPLFFVGHIHADIIWYLIVGAIPMLIKNFMTDAAYRWVVIGGGVFLIGFGVYFAAFARWHAPKAEPAAD